MKFKELLLSEAATDMIIKSFNDNISDLQMEINDLKRGVDFYGEKVKLSPNALKEKIAKKEARVEKLKQRKEEYKKIPSKEFHKKPAYYERKYGGS